MFKQRLLIKNIILGTYNLLISSSNQYCNVANKLSIEKMLVVSKLSRYEYEKYRYKNLTDSELERKIRERGTDYDKLMHHHNLHKDFELKVVEAMESMGIEVRVVNRFNYSQENINWADVIVPTGGDGTFLLAASKINDNNKPVIGFNSDPNKSEGHLCLPKKYSYNIKEALEKLLKDQFKWLLRRRIRVTLHGGKGIIYHKQLHEIERIPELRNAAIDMTESDSKVLPFLALNEVFIGESLSARVSYLEMWLNGEKHQTFMKCSGLCVCTGTGSTSWHLSINRLPVQSVAELLNFLDIKATEGKDSLATVLAKMYNKNLIFSPDDARLGYTVRDLISAGVWPQPKGLKSRGFASKIKVKSNCYDAGLVIDGGISFSFNDGTVAILETHPEDALRTVTLTE